MTYWRGCQEIGNSEIAQAYLRRWVGRVSSVFEAGCGPGRNLTLFNGRVAGLDISHAFIRHARMAMPQGEWHEEDGPSSTWLQSLPDEWVDLCFTRWHLAHIPPGPDKTKYIETLMRIGKTFLALEPTVQPGRSGVTPYVGDAITSWEDWAEYGLVLVETLEEDTQVWAKKGTVWTNES